VDADGIAFQAASAVQRGIRWDDNIYTLEADGDAAQDVFRAAIQSYIDATDPDAKVILCYSCPTRRYFRHDILPTYKANRKDLPPLALKDLKAWSATEWDSRTKPGLEADDVVGILATHPKLIPGRKVIVSHDKDLQQIPGEHLSARSPSDGVFRVQPAYAERFLWLQVLTGDSTDNYPGCPGVGPVGAEKVLAGGAPYEERVLAAFEKAYRGSPTDPSEEMATQVNVARILQHTDYNFKSKEPIRWQYPTP
jgi:DNA polymerase I